MKQSETPQTTSGKHTKSKPKKFDTHELMDALLKLQENMERAATPFIVLGDIAISMQGYSDLPLESEGIKVALKRKDMHEPYMSILKDVLPKTANWSDKKITYEHTNGVPITIKIIDKNYGCLRNPDKNFYMAYDFNLPNPMEEYVKIRGFI
jgi:hypothetical protein